MQKALECPEASERAGSGAAPPARSAWSAAAAAAAGQENAAGALRNLSENDQNKVRIVQEGALAWLVPLMRSPSYKVLEQVPRPLRLAARAARKRREFRAVGGRRGGEGRFPGFGLARSLPCCLGGVPGAAGGDDINTMSFATMLSAQIAEW